MAYKYTTVLRGEVPAETAEKFKQRCQDYGVSVSHALRMLAKDWSDGHIVNKINNRAGSDFQPRWKK